MSKWLAAGVAAGLGLLILVAAISKKNVEYFRCWNCNRIIPKNSKICLHCNSHNNWGTSGV